MAFDYAPRSTGCSATDSSLHRAVPGSVGSVRHHVRRRRPVNLWVPNLRGRVPLHRGAGFGRGEMGGEDFHTVTANEMPAHTHGLLATSSGANQPAPVNTILASSNNAYTGVANVTSLHPSSLDYSGGNQPHENRQPFLVLNWCVAIRGDLPTVN